MSDSEYIQIQVDIGTPSGTWRTMNTVVNYSDYIAHAMKQLANSNPGKRIRAVDSNGRLVDML